MIITNWIPGLLRKNRFLSTSKLICFILVVAACRGKSEKQVQNIATNNEKEIVTFVYHRFGDSRFPSTNISLNDLKAHLEYLKNNNFQVLSFSDAIDYLQSDAANQKTAVITIDDGYKSFYQNALPVLKQYGFPATLFINTETVGSGDYMDWEDIQKASDEGIEIGNHTHSHAYFLNMPEQERYKKFEQEIQHTQEIIEKKLGFRPKSFAYPFGEMDMKMKEIVRATGFKAAAAQNSGVIYTGTDLMQCPRFPMSEYYSDIDKFKSKAQMKALRVLQKTPNSSLLDEGTNTADLWLTIRKGNLQIDQLQCFIQGAACEIKKTQNGDSVTVLLHPLSAINNQRRTLYTVTVPDKQGNWHWFSHLWVNPHIK